MSDVRCVVVISRRVRRFTCRGPEPVLLRGVVIRRARVRCQVERGGIHVCEQSKCEKEELSFIERVSRCEMYCHDVKLSEESRAGVRLDVIQRAHV